MASNERETPAPSLSGSSYDAAEASPGFLFWRAFNTWSRAIRQELEKLGLTQVQYSILAAVSYLGSTGADVSQQDVANQLSMDKMMVSDVVKTLEQKKMLTRRPHSQDGRAMALQLTAEGSRRLKKAVPAVEGADEHFFGRLEKDQRKKLMSFLIRLLE